MANKHKIDLLEAIRSRFGQIEKLKGSDSLFRLGNDAARIYVRYSKVHPGGRTFFGLREVDLRQLEGHNSFLCFILDKGSEPLFVPYQEFEEIFHSADTAKDGQFKAQLKFEKSAVELYIARQGRFNVEAYVGFESLEKRVNATQLREEIKLSHSQIQTLLGGIGHLKGYDVHVPANDRGKLDWSLTSEFAFCDTVPPGFGGVAGILSEIDVLWVARGGNTIEGLFEVEHSTAIYSALLRFNDVLLTDRKVSRFSIVSDDTRRALFVRQLFRPTFRQSGLNKLTSFLEYRNVVDWHSRITKTGAL